MKRTRKWTFVAQEAERLAELGLSPKEIGQRLGVTASTVRRWRQAGKIPVVRAKAADQDGVMAPSVWTDLPKPDEWASEVRATYDLDPTDQQLVAMGEAALKVIHNPFGKVSEQLSAMKEFRALVKQLALGGRRDVKAADEERPEAPKRTPLRVVQRPHRDPRKALLA